MGASRAWESTSIVVRKPDGDIFRSVRKPDGWPSSRGTSEKRTHLLYEFRRTSAPWIFVRKADKARHRVDLKSRQSGYDLKSHSRPLASILHQGESFLPHVRQKAEQRKSACISASACCGGPCQKPSSSWNTVVRSILHPGRENTSASVSFWLYTALVV